MTHTLGPWIIEDADDIGWHVITEERAWIAEFVGKEANARLIAAAPDMYSFVATRAASGDNKAIELIRRIDGNSTSL